MVGVATWPALLPQLQAGWHINNTVAGTVSGAFFAGYMASVPVLVDLWAPWCGPCRMVAPAVERVAHELVGHLKAVKVNVDESPAVAGRYQAKSIPTLILLRDGREIGRQIGALPADRLLAWARNTLGAGAGKTGR